MSLSVQAISSERNYPVFLEKKKSVSVTKVINACFLNPDIPAWLSAVGLEARSIAALIQPYFHGLIKFAKCLAVTQFTAALTMPIDLYQLLIILVQHPLKKQKKV